MYKKVKPSPDVMRETTVQCLSDNAFIPFDPANTDFARFKNEIQGIGENGESITPVELQDADGNTMTSEEVAEFITTLP
jgi:cytochrome oxidase Cu insertion factor (SCO1/SenC/PrrC family)